MQWIYIEDIIVLAARNFSLSNPSAREDKFVSLSGQAMFLLHYIDIDETFKPQTPQCFIHFKSGHLN